MEVNAITTEHNLDFQARPYSGILKFFSRLPFQEFIVGTCRGVFWIEGDRLNILAVINLESGNGHFTDVLQWFEHSAKEKKLKFVFAEVMNPGLRKHLVEKRGFEMIGDNAVKDFTK